MNFPVFMAFTFQSTVVDWNVTLCANTCKSMPSNTKQSAAPTEINKDGRWAFHLRWLPRRFPGPEPVGLSHPRAP